MAALDQLQRRFALADPALSHDQDTFSEDIHEHAVHGNARCQFHGEPADDLRHESARRPVGGQRRNTVFSRGLDHHAVRFRERREDDARNSARRKPLVAFPSLLRIQLHDVAVFRVTDDLDPLFDKIVVITDQREGGPVDFRRGNRDLRNINILCKILQTHLLRHLFYGDCFHTLPPLSCAVD